MYEIINYYNNYLHEEDYQIIKKEDGSGVFKLYSDIEGLLEFEKPFNNEEELNDLLLKEKIDGIKAVIVGKLEGVELHSIHNEGQSSRDSLLRELQDLKHQLFDIIFELDYITYELNKVS